MTGRDGAGTREGGLDVQEGLGRRRGAAGVEVGGGPWSVVVVERGRGQGSGEVKRRPAPKVWFSATWAWLAGIQYCTAGGRHYGAAHSWPASPGRGGGSWREGSWRCPWWSGYMVHGPSRVQAPTMSSTLPAAHHQPARPPSIPIPLQPVQSSAVASIVSLLRSLQPRFERLKPTTYYTIKVLGVASIVSTLHGFTARQRHRQHYPPHPGFQVRGWRGSLSISPVIQQPGRQRAVLLHPSSVWPRVDDGRFSNRIPSRQGLEMFPDSFHSWQCRRIHEALQCVGALFLSAAVTCQPTAGVAQQTENPGPSRTFNRGPRPATGGTPGQVCLSCCRDPSIAVALASFNQTPQY